MLTWNGPKIIYFGEINHPWLSGNLYKKPNKPLGDARRNKLAMTNYKELPENEKIINVIIAEYVSDLLIF